MLITHGDSVLMGRSPGWPEGMYSLLAGFVEPGETLEAAVRREVLEETGVRVGPVSYLSSQPWAFPMSLMFGCAGEALSREITIDPEEIEDALWISRQEMMTVFAGEHPVLKPARDRGNCAVFDQELACGHAGLRRIFAGNGTDPQAADEAGEHGISQQGRHRVPRLPRCSVRSPILSMLERSALRRGIELQRTGDLPIRETAWPGTCKFSFRGKPREIQLTMASYAPPSGMALDGSGSGVDGRMEVELLALSPQRTRMSVAAQAVAHQPDRALLVQSLKLARSNLNRRFKLRLADYARITEERLSRTA